MYKEILLKNVGYKDINPLICGEEACSPKHSYGPHVRGYYLLHYVLSGEGRFINPRGSRDVCAGYIFVIRPDELTTYTSDTDNPWHYRWIGFDCSIDMGEILRDDVIHIPECSIAFQSLMEAEPLNSGREMFVCGKIYEILALISGAGGVPSIGPDDYVGKALNYIHANYMQELSVSKIAGYLNIDRSYFCKLFRKRTGKPPQKYIVDYRLQKAAELISVHGCPPGVAATQSGYGDIANFSRMFKKAFGVSPGKYKLTAKHL